MTKARTNAQKLAAKRRRSLADAGLPALSRTPRRAKQGKARMKEIAVENDADIPALIARCRQSGRKPDEVGLRAAKAEWMGCNAGKAMAAVVTGENERRELWAAIYHMRRVQLAYDRAVGAPSRHAQCLRIMLPTETMQADASSPPLDLRSDEDKQRQAVSAWMQLQGWLGHADKQAAGLCKRVVIDDERCPNAAAMVTALHCVADGMAGRKIMYRAA